MRVIAPLTLINSPALADPEGAADSVAAVRSRPLPVRGRESSVRLGCDARKRLGRKRLPSSDKRRRTFAGGHTRGQCLRRACRACDAPPRKASAVPRETAACPCPHEQRRRAGAGPAPAHRRQAARVHSPGPRRNGQRPPMAAWDCHGPPTSCRPGRSRKAGPGSRPTGWRPSCRAAPRTGETGSAAPRPNQRSAAPNPAGSPAALCHFPHADEVGWQTLPVRMATADVGARRSASGLPASGSTTSKRRRAAAQQRPATTAHNEPAYL